MTRLAERHSGPDVWLVDDVVERHRHPFDESAHDFLRTRGESSGDQAAVDGDRRAREVAATVAAQVRDEGGNVLGAAVVTERCDASQESPAGPFPGSCRCRSRRPG
jgi:hypothetical protein